MLACPESRCFIWRLVDTAMAVSSRYITRTMIQQLGSYSYCVVNPDYISRLRPLKQPVLTSKCLSTMLAKHLPGCEAYD